MHHPLQPLDPHRHDVRAWLAFQNEARNAPFQVAHLVRRVLADFAFGEDVKPSMVSGGVGSRVWEAVGAGGCEGLVGVGEKVGVWRIWSGW